MYLLPCVFVLLNKLLKVFCINYRPPFPAIRAVARSVIVKLCLYVLFYFMSYIYTYNKNHASFMLHTLALHALLNTLSKPFDSLSINYTGLTSFHS